MVHAGAAAGLGRGFWVNGLNQELFGKCHGRLTFGSIGIFIWGKKCGFSEWIFASAKPRVWICFLGDLFTLYPWEIIIKPAFGRICVPFSNHLFRKSKKILLTKLQKASDLKSTKISKSWWSKQNTTSGGNKTQPAVEINHVFLGWCDWTPGTEFILGVFWDVLATFPAREGLEWCVLLVS